MMESAEPTGAQNVVRDYQTREAWLASRTSGIGASEAAALYGLSPYASAYSLWAEKSGRAPAMEIDGEWLEWGRLLETPIAQRYELKTGRKLWRLGEYCVAVHREREYMFSTPDFWVVESELPGSGLCQIKNAMIFKERTWEDGPPMHVQIQVQHEMSCTGRDWTSVAVLIGGCKFAYWDVQRNDEFIEEHERQCALFWERVQSGDAPPIDGHHATVAAVKRLHPLDNGETIDVGDDVADAWERLNNVKAQIKGLEAQETLFSTQVRAAIGPNTFARLPGGRLLSLKHQSVDPYVVPGSTYRRLAEVSTNPKNRRPKKGRSS